MKKSPVGWTVRLTQLICLREIKFQTWLVQEGLKTEEKSEWATFVLKTECKDEKEALTIARQRYQNGEMSNLERFIKESAAA